MLLFRPISFNEGDFRTVKYIGTSAVREGRLCFIKKASQADVQATLYTGTKGIGATTNLTLSNTLAFAKTVFPIYRENPDTEAIGTATINRNDYCIAFYGQEWEVHKSQTESGYATTWTAIGQLVAVGSTGKFAKQSGKNDTSMIIAECIGTFNGTWIRMRSLIN